MAVSITQRPAAWSPINNPVVYKFATTGGPFTNYRIEVEVFAGGVSVGAIFSFTPNSSNVTTADISAILKSILYRDWELPAGVNESEDGIGSTDFYIKYQELYTGSATSQTSDSANTKIGVLAGLQIGSSADLDLYVLEDSNAKFLTNFDTLKLWDDYPLTLSFLYPATSGIYRTTKQYDVDGNFLSSDLTALDSSKQNALNRLALPSINSLAKTVTVGFAIPEVTVAPSAYTDGANAFAVKNSTLFRSITMNVGVTYSAYYQKVLPAYIAALGITPEIITTTIQTVILLSPAVATVTFAYKNSASGNTIFQAQNTYTSSGTFTSVFTPVQVNPYEVVNRFEVSAIVVGGSNVADVIITLPAGVALALTAYTEIKTIEVQSACKNPVYLIWKNSLGGDASWMFYFGQEDYFTYENGRKAKRQVLYAEGLSYNEWEIINELNTPGDRYRVAIPELTTSVDKTDKRTDQQVYVVDTDGNKTGVVVIPRSTSARTDKKIHSISIEIEYPTIFL